MSDQELIARLRHEQNKRGWELCEEDSETIKQVENVLIRNGGEKRFRQKAKQRLKRWASGYLHFDRREIRLSTGSAGGSALGNMYRRANKQNRVYDDIAPEPWNEELYQQVNEVVLSVSEYNKAMIFTEFIERDAPITEFCKRVGVSQATYYRDLNDALGEFIIRGGIL